MNSPFVRADVRAFLDVVATSPLASLESMNAVQARLLMEQVRKARAPIADNLAVVRELECPGPSGHIKLRLYDSRAERAKGPLIIYFHGGGFVLGDLDSHHPLCLEIARAVDLPVVSVNYRLAPENPWPAASIDAEAVARWVASDSAKKLGREVSAMVFAGDSAGANLAVITAKALLDKPAALAVRSQWLIYPTTGDNRETRSKQEFASGYFLTKNAIDWFNAQYAAPLNNPGYDLFAFAQAGLPPTLLVTASLDPLRDEGRAYAAALISAGVPVVFQEAEGSIHGAFSMSAAIPSTVADIRRACAALRLLIDS